MSDKSWKPGEKAPRSGQYQIVGPRGRRGPERTIVKDEPFPPTLRPNQRFVLVDPTRTKGR
jgi:hypothetical protein